MNGIEALARYVHHLGLKFGLYVTPGISKQAVARNTRIEGTPYRADQIASTSTEKNYNCGGMVGIDYAKRGAQAFLNSWADQFASWGVDYLKLDGVGPGDVADVKAWSRALRQTGRPIYLGLSNSLSIKKAATWKKFSNSWRTGPDINCYCGAASANSGPAFAYPLTIWYWVETRFDAVAQWAPDGGTGGYNDDDALEIGNGVHDGLNPTQRQTYMSLWALGSSPLILGADLTHLNPLDRTYLLNRPVISVDQDGIDARRVSDSARAQVFAKTERDGDVVVGLFNTSATAEVVSTTAQALHLSTAGPDELDNLWTHHSTLVVRQDDRRRRTRLRGRSLPDPAQLASLTKPEQRAPPGPGLARAGQYRWSVNRRFPALPGRHRDDHGAGGGRPGAGRRGRRDDQNDGGRGLRPGRSGRLPDGRPQSGLRHVGHDDWAERPSRSRTARAPWFSPAPWARRPRNGTPATASSIPSPSPA